ncbi:MAG: hypothetical protein NVSMB42_11460 [Herpetosiphon sp.]
MQETPMVPPGGQRTEQLFIVRIWQEFSQIRSGHWRGSVEHVPSGQRRYFASLDDLNAFILRWVKRETAPEQSQ